MTAEKHGWFSKIAQQKPAKITRGVIAFGGAHDLYGRLLGYYNWVAWVMNFAVFYAVVIDKTPWLAWVSFQWFLVACVPTGLLSALVLWKYIVPRVAAYNNYIANQNANIVVQKLDEVLRVQSDMVRQCSRCKSEQGNP